MKPEIKELWLNALPNYKQGRTCLRNEEAFCCLGVLTDLYIKETGNLEWHDKGDVIPYDIRYKCVGGDEEFLPFEVVKWAGLDNDNPSFEDSTYPEEVTIDGRVHLSILNDKGYDFQQIAELIQKHF